MERWFNLEALSTYLGGGNVRTHFLVNQCGDFGIYLNVHEMYIFKHFENIFCAYKILFVPYLPNENFGTKYSKYYKEKYFKLSIACNKNFSTKY